MPETRNYAFFTNRICEYFPCHATEDPEEFNCLFCYCPLYALGPRCGGNFSYNERGIKDCSDCMVPHRRQGYDYIISRYPLLMELARDAR
ncbi:MAG: cysteine-rich small domain-containing protein [Oscillospiraceae bacterium]